MSYAKAETGDTNQPNLITDRLECQSFLDSGRIEGAIRIALVSDLDDVVWKPEPIVVDPPDGQEDVTLLLEYLGDRYNSTLTRPTLPTGEIVLTRADFQALFANPIPGPSGDRIGLPTRPNDDFYDDDGNVIQSAVNELRQFLTDNDLGSGGCSRDMMFMWSQLPEYYFPDFFLSGFCRNGTCAIPEEAGHRCTPDTGSVEYVGGLRWDCCYNLVDGWYLRKCGWRDVEIPIVRNCLCSC